MAPETTKHVRIPHDQDSSQEIQEIQARTIETMALRTIETILKDLEEIIPKDQDNRAIITTVQDQLTQETIKTMVTDLEETEPLGMIATTIDPEATVQTTMGDKTQEAAPLEVRETPPEVLEAAMEVLEVKEEPQNSPQDHNKQSECCIRYISILKAD